MKNIIPTLICLLSATLFLSPVGSGEATPRLASSMDGARLTNRVSVASDGTQANDYSWSPSISADGRFVAFQSTASNLIPNDTNHVEDIFVHDRQTGQTERVSTSSAGRQCNGGSLKPTISASGRFVVFLSAASNLVSNDTNSVADTFVHDRQTGETTRISVASDGTQGDNGSFDTNVAIY